MTRAKYEIIYACNIPTEYLQMNDDDFPPDFIEVLNRQNGLMCDGGGYPGDACRGCHYYGGKESIDYLIDENGDEL